MGWALALAQVMLKDLADSKRVNANIKALPEQALSPLRRSRRRTDVAALDATVISALFWPPPLVQARLLTHALAQAPLARYGAIILGLSYTVWWDASYLSQGHLQHTGISRCPSACPQHGSRDAILSRLKVPPPPPHQSTSTTPACWID